MSSSFPDISPYYDYSDDSSGFNTETILTSPPSNSTPSSLIGLTLTSFIREVTVNIFPTEDPSVNYTGVAGASIQFRLYDYLIPSIGGIILLLNLAVVISSGLILRRGAQPRTTYLFLGNVAVADLVTSAAMLFGQLYPREHRNELMCMLQIGMIVSDTLASIWNVLLIGIDRFIYIVHGMKYKQWLNPCRARWLILCTWILGLIIGFMRTMGWKGWTNGGKYCWFILLAPHGLVLLTGALGCLPIAIITVLYIIILYHAIKKVMQLQKSDQEASTHVSKNYNPNTMRIFRGSQSNKESSEDRKQHSPKKSRAIIVVLLTTGSFIVTWLPYFIASAMHVFCEKRATDENTCKSLRLAIASPLAILGFLNSLINPLIYAWWHKGFRTFVFTKILHRKTLQNQADFRNRLTRKRTSNSSTVTTASSTYTSDLSRPTSLKKSSRMIEGPYIGDNEDTHL